MKYAKIYDVLKAAPLSERSDFSGWRSSSSTWVNGQRPLWIVAESEKLDLRMWIIHESGRFSVTTAGLHKQKSLNTHGPGVSKTFRNQTEMAAFLRELLFPDDRQVA